MDIAKILMFPGNKNVCLSVYHPLDVIKRLEHKKYKILQKALEVGSS